MRRFLLKIIKKIAALQGYELTPIKEIGTHKKRQTGPINVNSKMLNKSELARLYEIRFGERISSQYIRALLSPTDSRKNPKQLARLKELIKQTQIAA